MGALGWIAVEKVRSAKLFWLLSAIAAAFAAETRKGRKVF